MVIGCHCSLFLARHMLHSAIEVFGLRQASVPPMLAQNVIGGREPDPELKVKDGN